MATPPTLAAIYGNVWNTGTTPKTTSVTVAVGDVLVVLAGTAYQEGGVLSTPTGGSGFTWTLEQSNVTGSNSTTYAWTTTATSAQTFTLSIAMSGSGAWYGFICYKFTGSDGIGTGDNKALGSGGPSVVCTTGADNSALVALTLDWNAASGASRTWRTVNSITPTSGNSAEKTYFFDASMYTAYSAIWSDAGTAGAKTVGLSAPTGQKFSIVGVEVKGSAGGGGPTTYQATGTVAATSAASGQTTLRAVVSGAVAAVSAVAGAVTALLPTSGAVAATSTVSGSVTRIQQVSGTVAATSGVSGSPVALLPATGAVVATSGVAGSVTSRLPTTGTVAATSTVSGFASLIGGATVYPVSGTVAATTGVAGSVTARRPASGVIAATSGLSGSVTLRAGVTGTTAIVSSVTGDVTGRYLVGGTVVVVSSVSGYATGGSVVTGPDVSAGPPLPPSTTAGSPATVAHSATLAPNRYATTGPAPLRHVAGRPI